MLINNLTICIPLSSVIRHQFLSQKFLCCVQLDIFKLTVNLPKKEEEKLEK